jgi:RNA polymerase sigma-70 factor (ECF subfamily)
VLGDAMCETEAIKSAQKGEPAGLGRLYELHKSRIYALCLRYTNNAFDAEDLTQEVFMQVSRKVGTYRGDAQFKSWLWKVALNMVRLHRRRKRRDDRFVVEGFGDEILWLQGRDHNPAQTVALKEALGNVTALRRQTVLLHDLQGFTHHEIACRMRATVVASKSRLHQAHLALRNILGESTHFSLPRKRDRSSQFLPLAAAR